MQGQHQHVHAFGFGADGGRIGVMAGGGPNTRYPVGGHGSSHHPTGKDDAAFRIVAQHQHGHLLGVVGAAVRLDRRGGIGHLMSRFG